jgi:transcriptional regulator with XRE-family HTH domain
MGTPAKTLVKSTDKDALLGLHQEHAGLYRRVASRLGVDASYVSRVASGERASARIMQALLSDLSRLHKKSLNI